MIVKEQHKITFLHTSKSHIKLFDDIIEKFHLPLMAIHVVCEELLAFSIQTGKLDKDKFMEAIQQIKASNSEAIICTCSTYGQLSESLQGVYRIDRPIAQHLIQNYSNIGLAFTLASTKDTSRLLLENTARAIEKPINIREIDCSHCWKWFEQGELACYEQAIAEHLNKISQKGDIVLLAQASMAGAKKYISKDTCQVFSSAEFGVKYYSALLLGKKDIQQ